MRTLLGAVIGLGLGSLLMAILISQGIKGYWPMLPVGLIVGLAVRSFSKNNHGGYAGGGLAALATVAALVVGPLLATKIIALQGPERADKAKSTAQVAEADASDEADASAAAETAEAKEPVALPAKSDDSGPIRYRPQMKQKFPIADAICLAIGCLIAYEIGKGKAATVEGVDEPSEETPPADEEAST